MPMLCNMFKSIGTEIVTKARPIKNWVLSNLKATVYVSNNTRCSVQRNLNICDDHITIMNDPVHSQDYLDQPCE